MDKVNAIIEILKERYPDSLCALGYEKDYELRSPSVWLPSVPMHG